MKAFKAKFIRMQPIHFIDFPFAAVSLGVWGATQFAAGASFMVDPMQTLINSITTGQNINNVVYGKTMCLGYRITGMLATNVAQPTYTDNIVRECLFAPKDAGNWISTIEAGSAGSTNVVPTFYQPWQPGGPVRVIKDKIYAIGTTINSGTGFAPGLSNYHKIFRYVRMRCMVTDAWNMTLTAFGSSAVTVKP